MAKQIQLSSGPIEFVELGAGRPIVFVHGILAGPELWMPLAERLAETYRCIIPTWPLGTHHLGMSKDADMSPHGVAAMVAELLEHLDLEDVVLVGNDSGGAICQLVVADHGERVGALVLTNCDAFELFPPPMFAYLRWTAFVPGGYTVLAKLVHWLPFLRKLPIAWGSLSATDNTELYSTWSRRLAENAAARRDVARFARTATRSITMEVAERLGSFEKPALLVWGQDDRFFQPRLAERLAEKLPDARVELVANARTFVSLDQPDECAERMLRFLSTPAQKDVMSQ